MNYVAIRMLLGDGAKFLALVLGLAFASTLVLQQGAMFLGLMDRAGGAIENVREADLWVMYPGTRYFDERHPIPESTVPRVRGVDGVEWASPYLVTEASARLPDGTFAAVRIVGIDATTRVGMPSQFVSGRPEMINDHDAVLYDNLNLPINKKIGVGDVLEINDLRAVIAAEVAEPIGFTAAPTIYTTYERAQAYAGAGRHRLTYALVNVANGEDPREVAGRIEEATNLQVMTGEDFAGMTERFQMINTGIAFNFATTVLLGALVGIAIAAQTFYSFVLENAKNFATFKAMGLSSRILVRMVLLQSLFVALIGWGIGAGVAAAFGWDFDARSEISYLLSAPLLAFSFAIMVFTALLAALVATWRVLAIEPALVFR